MDSAALPVNLVVATDVEQDDFFFGDQQSKGDAVAVGETDSMTTGKFPGEGMQRQTRLERINLQLADDLREAWLEVRVLLEESAGLTQEPLGYSDGVHQAGSSASIA